MEKISSIKSLCSWLRHSYLLLNTAGVREKQCWRKHEQRILNGAPGSAGALGQEQCWWCFSRPFQWQLPEMGRGFLYEGVAGKGAGTGAVGRSLQSYRCKASTVLKLQGKRIVFPNRFAKTLKKKGNKWGRVELQEGPRHCQVPWPDRCTTSRSKCCLPPWGCPSLFSTWLVVLLSPIWKDSHVT